MQTEAVFKVTFGVWVVLFFIIPIGYAQREAMREHGSRFAQAANEYPPLLWVRGSVGIPLWVFLIDWLLSAHWFPWASVSLPVWARWSGVGFGGVVAGLMMWTMLALGSNYRGAMGLHPKIHADCRLTHRNMYGAESFPLSAAVWERVWRRAPSVFRGRRSMRGWQRSNAVARGR